jgi:hypothetical protein
MTLCHLAPRRRAEDAPPLHIVGARQELGRLAASGRPRLSPALAGAGVPEPH